jgi:hypothetical protein
MFGERSRMSSGDVGLEVHDMITKQVQIWLNEWFSDTLLYYCLCLTAALSDNPRGTTPNTIFM